ncbi:MAG: hypothetical protein ABSE68_03035 [Minisyncoccia bacterium]
MYEILPRENQIGEKAKEIIRLDKTLFDRIDNLLKETPPGEDRELLEQILTSAKKKSFEYTEEALDMILDSEKHPEKDEGSKEENNKKSHDVNNAFVNIDSMLRVLNIPNNWPSDYRVSQPLYKVAALDYVIRHALDYEKRVLNGQEDKKEVLDDMKLTQAIDVEYMEDHIINKINNLPTGVKNNLLLVEKTQ